MYIVLGKNDNYIPITNVKAVTPFDVLNPEQGCNVILMSGEKFKVEGKSPKDIFDSVKNVPNGFRVIADAFHTHTDILCKHLSDVVTDVESYKRDVNGAIQTLINKVEKCGNDVSIDLSELSDKVKEVNTTISKHSRTLSTRTQEVSDVRISLEQAKEDIVDTLKDLDELLKSEADCLSGYESPPIKVVSEGNTPLPEEDMGI